MNEEESGGSYYARSHYGRSLLRVKAAHRGGRRQVLLNRWWFLVLLIVIFILGSGFDMMNRGCGYCHVVGKQIEVADSFCIQGSQAVVLIRNTGTKEFNPAAEITVINATSGMRFNVWSGLPPMINWSNADGSNLTGNLGPNKIARFNAYCPAGTLCLFMIRGVSSGRTVKASVQC